MTDQSGSPACKQFGAEVNKLLDEAKISRRGAVGLVGGVTVSTVQDWCAGHRLPSEFNETRFWALVQKAQAKLEVPLHSEAEWQALLSAAREEKAGPETRDPKQPFVLAHPPTQGVRDELVGRHAERLVSLAFVRAFGPHAPSYLCWHAELAVGKTALLADLVKRPPPTADIVNFFVSRAHGTDSRAAFIEETGVQMRAFLALGEPGTSGVLGASDTSRASGASDGGGGGSDAFVFGQPRDGREWGELLGRAVAKSVARGRRLLLVVDGLDDDVAWLSSERSSEEREESEESEERDSGGGSIAGLLPGVPGDGLRVLVSLRRTSRFPGDVPAGHPLRLRACLRQLGPFEGAEEAGRTPRAEAGRLLASELGGQVVGLLAVAGGNLRAVDLASLTGASVDEVDRLVHGADGRCIVLDDAPAGTYALAPGVLSSVRDGLDPAVVSRHAQTLHAWAERLRGAGWPPGTPPYLLNGYHLLLDDLDFDLDFDLGLGLGLARRAAYVLDGRRQVRCAAEAGGDVALGQVKAVGTELHRRGLLPGDLSVGVRLAASRGLLSGRVPRLPGEAVALCVRLGGVSRALSLARAVPGAVARATLFAEAAVELRRAGHPEAGRFAREAAEWAALAEEALPRLTFASALPAEVSDAYALLARAAHELRSVGELSAARGLFRAALRSGVADVETVVTAGDLLASRDDVQGVTALFTWADHLSMSGLPTDHAAAVDIWATIAGRILSLAPRARDHIEAHCADLDPSFGLMRVDILALGAIALKSRKTVAPRLVEEALELLRSTVRAGPAGLSPADRGHLRRELSTTLDRLSRAVDANGKGAYAQALSDIKVVVAELPESMRTGVLGDDLTERARANIGSAEERREADEERRHATDAARQRQEKERKLAARRKPDAANRRGKRNRQKTGPAPSDAWVPYEPDPGLPPHLGLLHHADWLLGKGNLVLARESLASALRTAPGPVSGPGPVPVSGPGPVPVPVRTQGRSPGDGRWTCDLVHALGVIGEFVHGVQLAELSPDAESRGRHLAALSLGCSQGGYGAEALRYGREAALLVADGSDPEARWVVAQALAYAGEAVGAEELARRRNPSDTMRDAEFETGMRRSLAAVAAGVARHAPEAAGRIVSGVLDELDGRIGGVIPVSTLPELVALLLAFPGADAGRAGSRWGAMFRRARGAEGTGGFGGIGGIGGFGGFGGAVGGGPGPGRGRTGVVLALLDRLRVLDGLPEEDADGPVPYGGGWGAGLPGVSAGGGPFGRVPFGTPVSPPADPTSDTSAGAAQEVPYGADAIGQWERTLPPDQVPYAELALFHAVSGDAGAARRVAEGAPTAGGRGVALAGVAAYLGGVPAVLDPAPASPGSGSLRLCLALAHAATGSGGRVADPGAARSLVQELLGGEGWTYVIPLLPLLAPEALVPLSELVWAHGSDGAGEVEWSG
ncbi:hypothetical protein AB0O07_26445 [Streptomyces sp. NPDC093085]|uniref:hypothetical protein n=1 Tax=Streptomyces sp. NPDC093085 TaxID=3155068 RepID=UPI0034352598